MINNIIQTLKKPSRLILLVGSIVVFAFTALTSFSGIDGGFFPVFIGIIVLIATLAATAAVPTLLILQKDKAAKIVFSILAAYWVISTARGDLSYAVVVDDLYPDLYIAAGIFSVFFGLCLLAVIVLLVLHFTIKKDFKLICLYVAAGALLFGFIAMILWCVIYGKQEADWTQFISEINRHLVIPVTIIGGALFYFIEEKPMSPKKEKKEEPKVEAQPAEQPVEQAQEQPEIAGENQ